MDLQVDPADVAKFTLNLTTTTIGRPSSKALDVYAV